MTSSRPDTSSDGDGDGQPEAFGIDAVLRRWERYRVGERLGAGGNGLVWRAIDPVLNRPVALKFLRSDDAALAARLLREAQAQARIAHPHICDVYEVGVVEGRPYIAMQLVDGMTLAEAAPSMSLTERVQVMRDVADAIHAAHRQGLIHRDLKPTNVMVERKSPDEPWRAFVLDFGLVRDLEAAGSTASGQPLGTPAYMAPEQVRGENAAIDRRTDVYGLGATLYEALTGKPPFAGTGMEVMLRVLRDQPTPPRGVVPGLSADLETLVLTCLEKTPAHRYPTAAALVADLEHVLDGEPIEARRPGLARRMRALVRRHRVLTAVALAALVNVAVLGVVTLRQRRTAQARAGIAHEFGRSVEQVQGMVDRARLLPLHDVRDENRAVRRRIGEIEAQLGRLGPYAEAPGHYAMGRGYLALRDWPAARTHLERAWELGERTPDAALALGTVLGELYQIERTRALALTDDKEREARLQELVRTLRDPALARLHAATVVGPDTAVREGLIALYEERYDDALRLAEAAARALPWSWSAKHLVAQTRLWRAFGHTRQGQLDEATAELAAAAPVIDAAVAIARSEPALYDLACDRWLETMRIAERRNANLDAALAGVRQSCGASRAVDPDRAEPYIAEARALDFATQYQVEHGQDPRDSIAATLSLTQAALERQPANTEALELEASADETLGDYQQEHGIDPRPAYARAESLLDQVLARLPSSANALMSSGNIYGKRALFDDTAGRDPRPSFDLAEARFRRARELKPILANAWGNEGVIGITRGEWQLSHGQDPTPSLRMALRGLEEAVKVDPSTSSQANLAAAWNLLARHALWRGADPSAELAHADEVTDRVLAKRPAAAVYTNRAETALLRARHLRDQKKDVAAELGRARGAVNAARALDGDYLSALLDCIDLEVFTAQTKKGKSATEALARAQTAAQRARSLQPKNAEVLLASARLQRARVEQGAVGELDQGIDAAAASLAVRDGAEAHAVKGALYLLGARAGRHADGAKALAELDRALTANAFLTREYGPLRDEAARLK